MLNVDCRQYSWCNLKVKLKFTNWQANLVIDFLPFLILPCPLYGRLKTLSVREKLILA